MKKSLPLLLMVVLLVGCKDKDAEPDFFYDAEGPVLIVKQATNVRQLSLFLDQFGESELRPTKEDETPESPNDAIRDSNSLLVDSNDFIIWNNYDTCEYVFDANSDPLILGRVLIHWLKTNPETMTNINISVPHKDKAEYDAILEGMEQSYDK